MKTLNEWKSEQSDNPDTFIDNIEKLTEMLNQEVQGYTGDRTDGFLEMLGSIKGLRTAVQEVRNGIKEL
jgi:hypothetical protein